jgi:cysteine desulfurase
MTYLDNAATTRVLPEVRDAMDAAAPGNPSSIHAAGRAARRQVEDARDAVAEIAGVDPKEVVFTSGATEANNLAVFGVATGHVVATAVEHPSVLEACAAFETTRVPVDAEGRVDPREVERAIGPRTSLVSVMWGNNETGVIEPAAEIAAIAKARGVPMHVDAAQACGKVRLRMTGDLMTISAHKMHGPKGAGALLVRRGVRLRARAVGGGQEFERRAGTENVAGILGLAKALELAERELDARTARMTALSSRLRSALARLPEVAFNTPERDALPHIVNARFRGVDGEAVVIALDAEGVCVSSGSACASQSLEPSHVLLAMGLTPEEARGSVRFSFGADTTEAEVDRAAEATAKVVARLRGISSAV